MAKKKASSTLYFIFFFIIFLAFCAFAVDGAIVLTNRAKLQNATEMVAMAAASEFNSDSDSNTVQNNIITAAQNTFKLLKNDSLQTAKMDPDPPIIDTTSRTVTITTSMVSQPFFLRFLGVSGINLNAKAVAQSEDLWVTANYTGVNWLTKKAAYYSDILSKQLNLNDTAILKPLGDYASASYSSGSVNFGLINSGDNQPLSLGPGGFITIKLPAPIVDKPGNDLEIKEVGDALEGYMVFIGLDNDPNQPYVSYDQPNGGISWVNISCTGTPENSGYTATSTAATNLASSSQQDKFYGSGYFDIGKSCSGFSGVSMAKYLRIIDDNSESAFVKTGGVYFPIMIYGESSSSTAGADIDAVKVLNHVRLTQD